MEKKNKCKRCKVTVSNGLLCQSCKSDLLPFFEVTKDWSIACDMESAQFTMQNYRQDYDDNNLF